MRAENRHPRRGRGKNRGKTKDQKIEGLSKVRQKISRVQTEEGTSEPRGGGRVGGEIMSPRAQSRKTAIVKRARPCKKKKTYFGRKGARGSQHTTGWSERTRIKHPFTERGKTLQT